MRKYLILLMLCLLSGFVNRVPELPVAGLSPFKVVPLFRAEINTPLDVTADGRFVAWGDAGLNMMELAGRKQVQLLNDSPDLLSWSHDGSLLASIVTGDQGSSLTVFDRNGAQIHAQSFPERIVRLQWLPTGVLALGLLEHKPYSFGTHLTGSLLMFQTDWNSKTIPIYETTISPSVARHLSGQLHQTFDFDISPLGDEILYSRLYAPPAFAPARHLMIRNLQTTEEKRIKSLPLLVGSSRITRNGEFALIIDGSGVIRRQELWGESDNDANVGNDFTYDAGTDLLFAADRLFQGKNVLLSFPTSSQVKIAFGGKFALVLWNHQAYLLSDYRVQPAVTLDPLDASTLRKLRRLRSRGLIEQHEYVNSRERLLQ